VEEEEEEVVMDSDGDVVVLDSQPPKLAKASSSVSSSLPKTSATQSEATFDEDAHMDEGEEFPVLSVSPYVLSEGRKGGRSSRRELTPFLRGFPLSSRLESNEESSPSTRTRTKKTRTVMSSLLPRRNPCRPRRQQLVRSFFTSLPC